MKVLFTVLLLFLVSVLVSAQAQSVSFPAIPGTQTLQGVLKSVQPADTSTKTSAFLKLVDTNGESHVVLFPATASLVDAKGKPFRFDKLTKGTRLAVVFSQRDGQEEAVWAAKLP